jgi:signal transduction histidine kinase
MKGTHAAAGAYRPRLQRRLMLAFAGYTLLVGTLLGGLSMAFVYAVEDEFFATTLRAEAQRQQAHRARQGTWAPPALPFVRIYPHGDGLPADLARQRAAAPQRQELAGDGGNHYHLHPLDADGTLLVAEVSEQLVVRPMRRTLLAWLAAGGTGLTLLALLLAWRLARATSAPLATLAQRVAGGAPDTLPIGLARGLARDEVGELARHLDALHERTRAFIAREQAFTADASHELRTPLSVLGLACERLHARAPDELRPLAQSMQAASWQLQQTVELMLALAREAPAAAQDAGERPLLPAIERLLLAHAPLLEQQGVEVEVDVPPGITRPWPDALAQLLLGHLLSNAIAHAQTPRVRITADAAAVSVCNPSLPPPAPLLGAGAAGRHRGVKGPASTGQGLGLSIASRLAERHGLVLGLSHDEGRTCATVTAAQPLPRGC